VSRPVRLRAGYIRSVNTLPRHLAAVWFADIVGYTRLSEENESEAVRLAHVFQRATRKIVDDFGGRVVKFMGDGVLTEFSSTEMAVRSAHALLAEFARAISEDSLPSDGLRVAVHVGDVAATEDGDLYGDGVNVASRLQSVAAPGEVWVSEDVWRQLRRRPELHFESRGEHELKGIGSPMQAHAVQVLDEREWTPPAAEVSPELRHPIYRRRPFVVGAAVLALIAAALIGGILTRDRGGMVPSEAIAENAAPGVVVLPFSVNDPELERWREGMVDLLSTNLDGAGGLRAIDSRTVLARWRELVPADEVVDLSTALEVARRSGGKYGLVGSAVSSGASIRLAAELYDLESGEALGRPQVEGSPDSIFGLVDRLSIQVLALILEKQGGNAPTVDLASVTTSSLPALKSFLEGEGLARRGDFTRAIPAYEDAIEADSTFALAHYRLGDTYGWSEGLGAAEVRGEYAAAKRFSTRLPARDADLLDVSLAYASTHEDATRLARQASQRYPDDPGAWYLLGEVYFHLPYQSLISMDEKREPFARAIRLDPTYLPARIHLVDIAFMTADEAAADSLMRLFDPATVGSSYGLAYSTTYALAFGDSTARSRAIDRLDSLPFEAFERILPNLGHPRFTEMQEMVFGELRARPEYTDLGSQDDTRFAQSLLLTGDLDQLTELIESGTLNPAAAAGIVTIAWFSEIPLPDEFYDHMLSAGPADTTPGPRLAAAAARALESGNRPAALAMIAGFETAGKGLLQAGDTAAAREVSGVARALAARDAMLRGRDDEALAELEAVYRESGFPPAGIWAAEILAEKGEVVRAIRYLEQFRASPIIGLQLGALYEKADRRDDAIEAYGWVPMAWANAHPALQPRVAEARQAIARLEGLRRD
jgi:class 3 adenylate cyclase/tetratricopeptide (TPR) repeat protein